MHRNTAGSAMQLTCIGSAMQLACVLLLVLQSITHAHARRLLQSKAPKLGPWTFPAVLPSAVLPDLVEDSRPLRDRPTQTNDRGQRPGASQIKTIQVVGERHTGTNGLRMLLENCLVPNSSITIKAGFGTGEAQDKNETLTPIMEDCPLSLMPLRALSTHPCTHSHVHSHFMLLGTPLI